MNHKLERKKEDKRNPFGFRHLIKKEKPKKSYSFLSGELNDEFCVFL
jgi:hypothetical protein